MQDSVLIGRGCVSEFFTHSTISWHVSYIWIPSASNLLFISNGFVPTQSQSHWQSDRLFGNEISLYICSKHWEQWQLSFPVQLIAVGEFSLVKFKTSNAGVHFQFALKTENSLFCLSSVPSPLKGHLPTLYPCPLSWNEDLPSEVSELQGMNQCGIWLKVSSNFL